jgi:peptidoglycan hydrolase CwlO-like protein
MSTEKKSWKSYISAIITVAVLVAGIVGSWYTNKAKVDELTRDYAKIEKRVDAAEAKIHEIELKVAVDSSILATVKEDIAEIKSDVKTLLER